MKVSKFSLVLCLGGFLLANNACGGSDAKTTSDGSSTSTNSNSLDGAINNTNNNGSDAQALASKDSAADGASLTGSASPGYVECGSSSCNLQSLVCCVGRSDAGNASIYSCLSTNSTCSGNKITCDEPGDCTSGQVCCRASGSKTSTCTAIADCDITTDKQRCHLDSDCPSALPKCCASASMSGGTCREQCEPTANDAGTNTKREAGSASSRDASRKRG